MSFSSQVVCNCDLLVLLRESAGIKSSSAFPVVVMNLTISIFAFVLALGGVFSGFQSVTRLFSSEKGRVTL